jgi:hypothetical protein
MNPTADCPACGARVPAGSTPCPACGSPFAGMCEVTVEPLRQEAAIVYGLLASAGLHPLVAYHDDSDTPHPLDEDAFSSGAGLMVPATTSFGIFVPEGEGKEARAILEDARRGAAATDEPEG